VFQAQQLHAKRRPPIGTSTETFDRLAGAVAWASGEEKDMNLNRRDFGKLALGAAATSVRPLLAAKPDSTFDGVRIGTITYSYRAEPGANDAVQLMKMVVDSGISAIELMPPAAENFAGSPAAVQGGSGGRAGGGRGGSGGGRAGGGRSQVVAGNAGASVACPGGEQAGPGPGGPGPGGGGRGRAPSP